MSDPTIRGRFVWHELMTGDTKSAAAFYSKAIGWTTQPWAEDGSYTLFLAGGRQMAGLMAHPDKSGHPAWVTYIATPDVDETARQAAAIGGKVHKPPTDIPTIGRFAIIEDPQGAMFSAFTPKQSASGAPAAPSIGDFSWHELATTDWRGALTFYQKLFGWEETSAMDMGPGMGTYQMFGQNGVPMGGMFNKPAQMPGPPSWLPYIRVPDAKKNAESIKKLGGQVINGPMEVPGGDWITQGLDLQGGMFAVHSLNPASAAAPPAKAPAQAAAKAKPAKPAKPAKRAKPAKKAKAKAKAKPAKKAAAKASKKAASKKPAKKAARPKKKAASRPARKAGRSAKKKSAKKR